MRALHRMALVTALAFGSGGRLAGQSTLTWAGPPLFILDLQGTPLDEFPASVKALLGVMTTVDLNGQRMLMASSPSEFLITLPQALPAAFTVILDIVPKRCCAPDDIMLEGMPSRNRGAGSAELTWHPDRISAVGGSPDMYQAAMPDDLAASTPGNPTRLVFEFNGTQIKLYTNGRRLYTLDKQFARGRVLRVGLGGESAGNPMYLAGLSVLSGAVAQGVIAANTGAQPGGGGPGGGVSPNPQTRPQPNLPPSPNTSYVPPVPPGTGTSPNVPPSNPPFVPPPPTGGNNPTPQSPIVPKPPTGGITPSAGSPNVAPPPTGSGAVNSTSPMVPSPPGSGTQSSSQAMTGLTPTTMRMAPTVTSLPSAGAPSPVVQWALLNGASGYTVKRWKSTDPTCCNNASGTVAGPQWQDAMLPSPGTYIYEVTASLAGSVVTEQAQFAWVLPAGTVSAPSTPTTVAPPPPPPVISTPIAGAVGTAVPIVVRMSPTVTVGGYVTTPSPLVQWSPITGALGYRVTRWKTTDLLCCNNASATLTGPPWQDVQLPQVGTYVYEVTASLTGGQQVTEQVQLAVTSSPSLPAPSSLPTLAPPPPPPPAPVVSAPLAASAGGPVLTASAPPPGSPASKALTPTGPPPTITTVTGTPVLAQLNWASGISGMRGVTYKVERWLESNPSCCTGQSATLTFPAWTDEGVQWAGAYVFRITEFYPDGTWGQVTTRWVRPDPVNPANFRAALVSAGSVYLRWDVVPNASWYELSGPGLGLPTFNATTGAYNVHNLAPGTYTWRVGSFYSSPNAPAPVSGPASAFPSVTVTVP